MLLDGGDSGGIVGELDFNGASFGDFMLNGKADKDFHVLLSNIQFVLNTHDLIVEVGDDSSQFEPPVVGSEGVGDGFGPSAGDEGVGLEGGIGSGDGEGELGEEGLEGDEGAIADFDC